MLTIIDGYVVEMDDTARGTITALDGSADAVEFAVITRFDPAADSLNVKTVLLSGALAIVLGGDDLAAGSFTAVFPSDTSAAAARALLARKTSFALDYPPRPALNMTFVRQGTISPAIHDQLQDLWIITVGFQEIEP